MIYVTWTVLQLVLCWICIRATAVSFYGESYVHVPLEDAFRKTDLELRFKTPRPYGLLFMIAGESDYFILQLHSGTLQLRINLGSVETFLKLKDVRLDDLAWHKVKVTSVDNLIALTVDDEVTVEKEREGEFSVLNIDSGVFLGGTDAITDELYNNQLKKFRGCLSDVTFNEYDVLAVASRLTDPGKVVEVSWDEDEIFSAERDAAISYQSETSFISFSHFHLQKDKTVSFEIQTTSDTALVLFSAASASNGQDYIALQLLNGGLTLSVQKDEEIVTAVSDVRIDDDLWHLVDIAVTTSIIEIVIDGSITASGSFEDNSEPIYAGGQLYLGGISQATRAVAHRLPGLEWVQGEGEMKGGIVGCIRNIVINSRAFSIHEIHVSRMISAGCSVAGDCVNGDCTSVEDCGEADASNCRTADSTPGHVPSSDSSQDDFQLLSVQPVTVEEGGRSVITQNNIDIIYNFRLHRIRESGILLHVIVPPDYGRLEKDLGRRRQSTVFTYLDIIGNKVSYIHDGSEETYDDISMEIEFHGPDKGMLPKALQERYAFILPINITSKNDAPRIIMGNNGVLKIIENTKIRITPDILNADDPDSETSDLNYIVTRPPSKGYFEKVGQIGTPLREFTQQEVNDRLIWFLHLGSGNSIVTLKLSDGYASSDPADLQVQTVQLQLNILKNTGLIMPHGTSRVIMTNNLTTASNVPTQEIEIRYEITQRPQQGIIEKQQYTKSRWREVTTFAQRHIDSGHIRYRQYDQNATPDYDQFEFYVKAKSYITQKLMFKIQFEPVYITVKTNQRLQFVHQNQERLTTDNLEAVTNSPQLGRDRIMFTIMKTPVLGDFYKVDPRQRGFVDFSKYSPLSKDSVFTQADIDNGVIFYKLRRDSYDRVQDFAELRVKVLSAAEKELRFYIEFIPLKSVVRFVNNGLYDVPEGDQKAILKHDLFIQTDEYSEFGYTVMSGPQHGILILEDPRSSTVHRNNISEFTNSDIISGSLVYKHDDSESGTDSFTFMAVPVLNVNTPALSEIPEFTGTFDIHMQMRNDNPPVRSVDKVFHVVTNKERLITLDDLAFTDPDIDYDSGDLHYTRRGIENGEIIDAETKEPVYDFKQRDLENKKIMFHHSGEAHGRAAIYVTDGQFYATSLFEVLAGDPYVTVTTNTGATVKSNEDVAITTKNLDVETNVNAAEINFVLTHEPGQGYLKVGDEEVLEFTYSDLRQGELFYQHHGGSSMEDHFRFAVVAGDAQTQGSFSIQIFLQSSQHPPRVVNNRVLEVLGNVQGVIDQSHLLISHPDSSAESIEYLILVLPQQGQLYRGGIPLTMDDMIFTQKDINDGRLRYQVTNTSATSDQFIFEVSNEFQPLRGLEFLIEIIPAVIPLDVKNFSVKEGGRQALTPNHLKLKGRYFEGRSAVFSIVNPPSHGIIESVNNRNRAISSFTSEDLLQGRIYYSHDDSEELQDVFSVQAHLENPRKESVVQNMFVTILGLNDEAPKVSVNKELEVWKGSMTQLTPDVLRADDPDTPAESIIFRISSPSNGHVSLLNNTFKPIANFTQALINDGAVVFVHTGAAEGTFSFQVSDGYNGGDLQTFHVTARPLILTLNVSEPINAYPMLVQPITNQHLFSSTNDPEQSKPIIYTLTSRPSHGRIVTIVQGRSLETNSFTQDELNHGEIFYKHEDQFSAWTQNDSFSFKVNTLYAEPLQEQELNIFISYGNLNSENKNLLIKVKGLSVDEGQEMVIAQKNLDVTEFVNNLERRRKRVSITYSIRSLPSHGMLKYRNRKASKGARFSQRDINRHQLRYQHDDSDTTEDAFNLTLHLRIENPSVEQAQERDARFNLTFNIVVRPVNDEPFKLVTRRPVIHLVQGFPAVINQSVLRTTDVDTEPAYLQYSVLSGPSRGYISFVETPDYPVLRFSQQDVNDGRVMYTHDGSLHSDGFDFSVTDGVFPAESNKLFIHVIEISLNITQNSTVILMQSESSVHITTASMNVTTNGLRDNVTYLVKEQPKFGRIYVREYNVTSFSQTDIDNKRLLYLQTDMSSGFDHFVCDVVYPTTNVRIQNHKIKIRVEPLVNMGPLEAPVGTRVAITLLNLDAKKLSEVTGDNPMYRVTTGPYFGRIVKKGVVKRQVYQGYLRGEASSVKPTTEFSHEDIVYMKVYYEADTHYMHTEGTKDNFTFQLTAYSAQPAEGVFHIGLAPSEDIPLLPVSPATPQPSGSDQSTPTVNSLSPGAEDASNNLPNRDQSIHPSNVKNDHILIIAILVPLLILVIVIVLVVFFVWRHQRKRDYSPPSKKSPHPRPHISGPFQIEQPHVHIEHQPDSSPHSEDYGKTIVEYQNTSDVRYIPDTSRAPSEEADVVTPMVRHDVHSAPRSPDISRTEISYTVPNCKVTPLIDNDEEEEDDDDISGDASTYRNSRNSTASDMFDWITSDPELLQHCRKTPPVLRKNQYWV